MNRWVQGHVVRAASRLLLLSLSACGPQSMPVSQRPAVTGRYVISLTALNTGASPGSQAPESSSVMLGSTKAAFTRAMPEVDVVDSLPTLPLIIVDLRDATSLERLRALPYVAQTWADAQVAVLDTELAVAKAPSVGTGAGTSVALFDTGLDAAKCSGCLVDTAVEIAPDDGQLDDLGHGTDVANAIHAVAPAARFQSLDVVSANGWAWSSDIIKGIDWVLSHRAQKNIVAINLSLGGDFSPTTCGDGVFSTAIAEARARGVLTVTSTGAESKTDGVTSPACSPSAIAVASTAPTANTAAFISLAAAGSAPQVSGLIATLAERFATDSADLRASRLLSGSATLAIDSMVPDCSTALSDTDLHFTQAGGRQRLTVTAPTACAWSVTGLPAWLTEVTSESSLSLTVAANASKADRMAELQVGGVLLHISQAADVEAPLGHVSLPASTGADSILVTCAPTDSSGVKEMCLSTTPECTAWEPYARARVMTFDGGDGVKTLYAWFRDAVGNTSTTPLTATTVRDTVAPVDGSVSSVENGANVLLRWGGFSDATTGVVSYRVVKAGVVGCTGTALYEGQAMKVSLPTSGHYRVCAVDAAGNTSNGAVAH